ncbi:MAG: FtsX-like permease family protein [Muribaculaceae bacterium]|nr:FtsX-like permease family protein [Muribaculaceae bacterium]
MTKQSPSGNAGAVAPRIAWRYLISKKSHSAVGAISVVSICGIAIATAAIICVLSVFNGFKQTIVDRLDILTSDILVTPAKGKVFENADSLAREIASLEGVASSAPILADNALAICDSQEMPVFLKGVAGFSDGTYDATAFKSSALPGLVSASVNQANTATNEDSAEEENSTLKEAYLSIGSAAGLNARIDNNILLFAPRREGRLNIANPASSFITDSVTVTLIFQTNRSETDENTIVTDIETVRDLLQYDSEASAIEISAKPDANIAQIISGLQKKLGNRFIVKDKLQQQEINFRMISIEKWITFLLLFFILVIASFNIISSLTMLVLDKEKAIGTLRAIGFSRRGIGGIFFWQSIFVTATGGIAGIILGIALTLLQQTTGIIRLHGDPGALLVSAYPVQLQFPDILLTMIPLALIGLLTAFITSSFARSRVTL